MAFRASALQLHQLRVHAPRFNSRPAVILNVCLPVWPTSIFPLTRYQIASHHHRFNWFEYPEFVVGTNGRFHTHTHLGSSRSKFHPTGMGLRELGSKPLTLIGTAFQRMYFDQTRSGKRRGVRLLLDEGRVPGVEQQVNSATICTQLHFGQLPSTRRFGCAVYPHDHAHSYTNNIHDIIVFPHGFPCERV
jgi:hypothetical protein